MPGAYDAMMRAGMAGGMGMQATPVHHVGKGSINKPEGGSIKDQATGFLGEVETALQGHRPGTPAYNKLMTIRGEILQGIADMDTEHQILQDSNAGVNPLDRRAQDALSRMHPYRRGITPEGSPVR